MTNSFSDAEARLALHEVERGRERVIDQIGMPAWYWWGLAACWIGLGLLSDLANAWVVAAATLAFGAVHSAVSQRLLAGRQRSGEVRVRADVAGRRAPLVVFGFLVALAGVTVAAAFAVYADGAGHPATIASIFVAALILLGGPRVMAAIRDHARRAGSR
jgi:FtsH-binding integral membrane protein